MSTHCGINQNLNKLQKFINLLFFISFTILIIATTSTTSSSSPYYIPLYSIPISERYRDRGLDIITCSDDSSKHSKSYRQISSILGKIPSRDASPSDIPNIHPSLSERCGKLSTTYFNGSISSFPIIETINPDITEHIATNVIPTTDGQYYTNKQLFLNLYRPAIDSGLPVSRIGSNAQCKSIKLIAIGIKNESTYYRIMELSNTIQTSISLSKLICSNNISFQDHLFIPTIETSIILSLIYRNGIFFNNLFFIHRLFFILNFNLFYLFHIITITKNKYSYLIYLFIILYLFII